MNQPAPYWTGWFFISLICCNHPDLLLLLPMNHRRIVDVDLLDERGDDFRCQCLDVGELPDKTDEMVHAV